MMGIKNIVLLIVMCVGMGMSSVAYSSDKQSIEKSLETTKQKLDDIKGTGFVWRWSYDRIKKSRQALESGDLEAAHKLAQRAAREAELAYEQIEKAEKNWEFALPK